MPSRTKSTSRSERRWTTTSDENFNGAIPSKIRLVVGDLASYAKEKWEWIAEPEAVSTNYDVMSADENTGDKPEAVLENEPKNISTTGREERPAAHYIDILNCSTMGRPSQYL